MNNRPQRKGPNAGPMPAEKANDFKSAIKRLFSELKSFHVLIIISLMLAAISSILSIVAPDKLSSLTDTISEGLVIDTKNFQEINTRITNSFNEEQIKTTIPAILGITINQDTTTKIMTSSDITAKEKEQYQNLLSSISKEKDKSN